MSSSTEFVAAEPAPARAPVGPLPLATAPAIPSPRAWMLGLAAAVTLSAPSALTVEPSTPARMESWTVFCATPTPIPTAPVIALGGADDAEA